MPVAQAAGRGSTCRHDGGTGPAREHDHRGTLDCYYYRATVYPRAPPSLHNIPCQSIFSTFALGNLCNARLQRHPHTLRMYLATS